MYILISVKRYVEVGDFECATGICPVYVAWGILDEVQGCLHLHFPDTYANVLAQRAERVFATQPFWRRKFCGARGRDYLQMTMRHWLAGQLAREQSALFDCLPDSFKVGEPSPIVSLASPKSIQKRAALMERIAAEPELIAV
jgi:hypothetical protein